MRKINYQSEINHTRYHYRFGKKEKLYCIVLLEKEQMIDNNIQYSSKSLLVMPQT